MRSLLRISLIVPLRLPKPPSQQLNQNSKLALPPVAKLRKGQLKPALRKELQPAPNGKLPLPPVVKLHKRLPPPPVVKLHKQLLKLAPLKELSLAPNDK